MIRHIVMWKLKASVPEQRQADADAIRAALRVLEGKIAGMRCLQVLDNLSHEKQAADLVLYSEFDDQAALDTYLVHPDHLAAKMVIASCVRERHIGDIAAD